MGDLVLEDTAKGRIIRLTGRLAIDSARDLKRILLEAFESHHNLEIELNEAEAIDAACIQVLCAAHRSFFKAGKDMTVRGHASEAFRQCLKNMAIYPSICDSPFAEKCLWNMELSSHG